MAQDNVISGDWAGTGNVIRVEDGGLIDVNSLGLPEYAFTARKAAHHAGGQGCSRKRCAFHGKNAGASAGAFNP